MEQKSLALFRECLPEHWVIRDYRPDYGLDLAVEVFDTANGSTSETLGEHFFVQLKSVQSGTYADLKVFPRMNVAKSTTETILPDSPLPPLSINTLRFAIETSELVTVQRMGPGAVVLLAVVDLSIAKTYFVCLNDYIDKVLLPQDPLYHEKKSKTVYLPTSNVISRAQEDLATLRGYAIRSKFYSASQVFFYQFAELQFVLERRDPAELKDILVSFIQILNNLDIWRGYPEWAMVGHYRTELDRLCYSLQEGPDYAAYSFINHVHNIWRGLTVLARNHEEIVREWYLPTHFAQFPWMK